MIEHNFSPTYTLFYEDPHRPPVAIRCKGCGLVSHHAGDVKERFCGFCHVFHNDIPAREVMYWASERQKSREVIELKQRQAQAVRDA